MPVWDVIIRQVRGGCGWYCELEHDGVSLGHTEARATPNEAALLALDYQRAHESGEAE